MEPLSSLSKWTLKLKNRQQSVKTPWNRIKLGEWLGLQAIWGLIWIESMFEINLSSFFFFFYRFSKEKCFFGRKTFSTNATLGQRGRFNPFIFLSCPCDAGSDAQTLSTRTVYFQMSHHIVLLLKDYTHTNTETQTQKLISRHWWQVQTHTDTRSHRKCARTHGNT